MARVTLGQLRELCQQVKLGRIPEWKVYALFGVENDEEGNAQFSFLDLLSVLVNVVTGLPGVSLRVTREKLQELLDGKEETVSLLEVRADDCGKVTVDYGRSLAQMIEDGHYCVVDHIITPERFSISGEGEMERVFVYVHHSSVIEYCGYQQYADTSRPSLEELLAAMDRCGLQPAKVEDALAFASKFPDEQRMRDILVVGSPWVDSDGQRYFICLGSSGGFNRSLKLVSDSEVLATHSILAVRKAAA